MNSEVSSPVNCKHQFPVTLRARYSAVGAGMSDGNNAFFDIRARLFIAPCVKRGFLIYILTPPLVLVHSGLIDSCLCHACTKGHTAGGWIIAGTLLTNNPSTY